MTNSLSPSPSAPAKRMAASLLCVTLLLGAATGDTIDRDGDGHSDIWQAKFGAPSLNPKLDADGDGRSNREEADAGTNPLDSDSHFRIEDLEEVTDARGECILLRWQVVAGKLYQVQQSAGQDDEPGLPGVIIYIDLNEATQATADGILEMLIPKPTDGDRHFYRVAVTDVDSDDDGLSAAEEFLIGTSDNDPISGGDPRRDDRTVAHEWVSDKDLGFDPAAKDNLREVDVAFLQSGLVEQSPFSLLVSAVGTGAWHQLSSWNLSSPAADPSHLHTTPPVEGHHPKVKMLPVGPNLEGQPRFVSGAIRSNGDLFLSSRQLNLGGAFTHHDSLGYGSNAKVEVHDYDMAVRTFSEDGFITHHHLVTPVMVKPAGGGDTQLRVVSWMIDASTGALSALQESGPIFVPHVLFPTINILNLPPVASEGRLSIQHLGGIQYVVTFTDHTGTLSNRFIYVEAADGNVVYGGGASSGQNLHGTSFFSVLQDGNALGPVTETGFITANRDAASGEMTMRVWESRAAESFDRIPFRITDNTKDTTPDGKGLVIPPPVLTDSCYELAEDDDHLGSALASGDFNGDGFDDVAVGAPDRDFDSLQDIGEVYIIHGSSGGITGLNQPFDQTWSQRSFGIMGTEEAGDRFGAALAVGDFNGDGDDDLAVGCPGEDVSNSSASSGGAVNILYGTGIGLTNLNNALFLQEDLGEASADFDLFGNELSSGDFNGDGYDDLAIAAPGREVGGQAGAGAVYILWGSEVGLSSADALTLDQNSPGISGAPEPFDNFGASLASGNFNGDPYEDLVIGVPNEDLGAIQNAGAVHILSGTDSLSFGKVVLVTQDGFAGRGADIHGTPEPFDLFGHALTTGDFNGDGDDDLAIGVPGEDEGSASESGGVNVLYAFVTGLTALGNLLITQDQFTPAGGDVPGTSENGDNFGFALTACNLDGDAHDELIVSAPGEGIGDEAPQAGAVFLIPGSATGLQASGSAVYHQDSGDSTGNMNGDSESGDRFGTALAAGDFDGNGQGELLVGIPFEGRGANKDLNAGAIQIIPGTGLALDLADDLEWFLCDHEDVRGMVSNLELEEAGGIGAGELFSYDVSNEWVHIASSTKCMTLLLAVEAIENGDVTLWDPVPIGTLAGETGGSKLDFHDPPSGLPATAENVGGETLDEEGDPTAFLEPGDTMPLNLLLHGMMMRSCNRSSVAIGQHIAHAVHNDPDQFINMMNNRAHALGMSSVASEFGTRFGHPAHGCVTRPQHLITLLREGSKHPLFLQFASSEIYGHLVPEMELCGTTLDKDGNFIAKCNNPFGNIINLSGYPGRLAYKGGNLGGWLSTSEANNVPPRPSGIRWCTKSQVGIVERAGHTLLMALQQTGDTGTDTKALLDFGFRQMFTPDACADLEFPEPLGVVGPEGPIRVRNFAVDAISARLGVVAMIDDFEELQLKIFDLNFTSGNLAPAGAAIRSYPLVSGARYAPPTLTDLSTATSTSSIGDYFTANQHGDHLDLKIWRVGEGFQ